MTDGQKSKFKMHVSWFLFTSGRKDLDQLVLLFKHFLIPLLHLSKRKDTGNMMEEENTYDECK